MGDFLLDFRPRDQRQLAKAAAFLKFFEDMQVEILDEPELGLVLTSADDASLWGSFRAADGSLDVWLAGRIAVDEREWDLAASVAEPGGLACKVIYERYRTRGLEGVQSLSGNFVVIIHSRSAREVHLITDAWGLFPAFRFGNAGSPPLYASHPDSLADTVGEGRNWDLTSFAEFILTGRLTSPHTYYRRIQALPVGGRIKISLPSVGRDRLPEENVEVYLRSIPEPQSGEDFPILVEQFATAFRTAVARRTAPRLGRSAVALSGGLDSRTLLSAACQRDNLLAFSCYDTENPEFCIARTIAQEARVKFVPLRRTPDFYADHAAIGTRISAGMGCIASNHFLGFRRELNELGINNLLTGCYCDYLFKGLALNKSVDRLTTRERLASFDLAYYAAHFDADTDLGAAVHERLSLLFPVELRRYDRPDAILAVERRRIFPLCYEEDSAERIIPQRTMGWYPPVADLELLQIYRKMTVAMRLNRRLFTAMVQKVCGPRICRIPDANTGVPVGAPLWREALFSHFGSAGRLLRQLKPSRATGGSWLNWRYYANNSPKVRALWNSPNREAREVFQQVLGDRFRPEIEAYPGKTFGIFLQLFTLKLWFDQRAGAGG